MASNYNNPINILDTKNAIGLGSGGSLNVEGGASIKQDTFIGGSLSVSGTSTAFSDNIMIMNKNPTSTKDTGILFERYIYVNEKKYSGLIYNETSDEFIFGYANSDNSGTGITFGNYIPIRANQLLLMSTENSIGLQSGGSLTVLGGASISKTLNVSNLSVISDNNTTLTTTGGNVGIGTSAPSKSLDIIGDINLTGDFYKNGDLYNPGSQWTSFSNNVVYTKGNIGINTTSPNTTLDVNGTANFSSSITTNLVSSSSYTGGSMSLSGDLVVGGSVVTVNVTTTNVKDINISTGTINVSDTAYITNATIPNLTVTNLSSATLTLSTGLTSASAQLTNANVTTSTVSTLLNTNAVSTNISSATLTLSSGLTSASAQLTNANVTTSTIATLLNTNAVSTNISSGTLTLSTGLTSASAQITNANVTTSTIATLLNTNAVSTNISSGTLNLSTGLTSASAQITNANVTTATIGTARVTTSLLATGNSNTIGSIFTTNGNVGIATTSPTTTLDVSGTIRASTSLTTGAVYSTNITSTNIVSTNISSATLTLSTGLTSASAQITNANVTTATIPTLLNTNAVSTNISSATLTLSTGLTSASAQITNANVTTSTVATLLNTNAVSTNISSATLNLSTGFTSSNAQITNANITTVTVATLLNTNAVSTNISSATLNLSSGLTSSSAQLTNANVTTATIPTLLNTNIISTNISGGTISATTFTGGNLSLSGDLKVAGTLTTVNITSTNLVNTNVSAGVVVASTLLSATGNSNTIGNIFTTGGNVGVGTTSPVGRLEVRDSTNYVGDDGGALYITGGTNGNRRLHMGYANTANYGWIESVEKGVNLTNLSLQPRAGNVGIGTTSPAYTLDVNGSFRLNSTAVQNFVIGSTSGTVNNSTYLVSSHGNLEIGIAGGAGSFNNSSIAGDVVIRSSKNLMLQSGVLSPDLYIATSGNIGIACTAPTHLFSVGIAPNGTTKGSISINTSDESRYHLFNYAGIAEWLFGQKSTSRSDFTFSKLVAGTETDYLTISTGGNVGIGTTSPGTTLDISGTIRASTSLTTGAVYSTNITSTNVVATNVSGGTLNLSTGLTSASAQITNVNVTTSTIATLLNTNAVSTNISSATLNLSTGLTSASAQITNVNVTTSTIATLLNTNAVSTNISSGTLNLSTGLTSASAQITNANVTTATIGTARVTTSLLATGNSNTIGSIFTTNGNVGIATTSPTTTLDVSGTIRASTSLTTGAVYSTNITSTNVVATNISAGTLALSNLNVSNATISNLLTNNQTIIGTLDSFVNLPHLEMYGTSDLVNPLYYFSAYDSNNIGSGFGAYINTAGSIKMSTTSTSWLLGKTFNGFNIIKCDGTVGSTATTNTRFIIATSGNIGIGTTAPAYTLDVNGTGRFTGTLTFTGAAAAVGINTATNDNYAEMRVIRNSTSSIDKDMFIQYDAGANSKLYLYSNNVQTMALNGGNVGIGTSSPGTKLDVSGTIRASTSLTTGAVYSTNITSTNVVATNLSAGALALSNINVSNATITNLLTSNQSIVGTLGSFINLPNIEMYGTSDLVNPLYFASAYDSNNIGVGFGAYYNTSGLPKMSTTSTSWLLGKTSNGFNIIKCDGTVGSTATTDTRFTIATSGNIGIGTTSPIRKLHVQSDMRIGGSGAVLDFGDDFTTQIYRNATASEIRFNTNSLGRMTITSSGNVGIGTTGPNPNFKLDVIGAGRFTGALTIATVNPTTFSNQTISASADTPMVFCANRGNIGSFLFTNGDASTGYVSINTSSYTLDVTGSGRFTGPGGVGSNGSLLITGGDTFGHSLYIASLASHKRLAFNNTGSVGNIFAYDYGGGGAQNLCLQGYGGNVGIGTSTPGSTLNVNGGGSFSGNNTITQQGLYLQWNRSGGGGESWIINQLGLAISETASIRFGKSNASNVVTEQMRITESGSVGIGTASPQATLHVNGGLQLGTADVNGFHFAAVSGALNAYSGTWGAGTTRWCSDSRGNFGIGTLSPTAKLHVDGTARSSRLQVVGTAASFTASPKLELFSSSDLTNPTLSIGAYNSDNTEIAMGGYINGSGTVTMSSTSSAWSFQRFNQNLTIQAYNGSAGLSGTAVQNVTTFRNNGNVAIANSQGSSISSLLCVGGVDAGGNGALHVISAPNTFNGGKSQDGATFKAWNDGNNIIQFYNSAGVIRGNIGGNGASAVTYNTSSDRRLKENVVNMSNSINIVKQMRPVEFTWRSDNRPDYGFIAQEMYDILPNLRPNFTNYSHCECTLENISNGVLCECSDHDHDEPVDKEGKPLYYGLDYGKITPYLTKALQETIAELEKLRQDFEEYKNTHQ